ncbi:adhesion G protein-coupled receptor E3-like isoform X6 [Pelodiscus sinensis]|uniref:adhesion G protein-coupled receptor E3-like isoform X6 n=1 Tax=Pelodiscus sinensis TaxID=13735 RepID=UPI003F6AA2E2
MRSRPGCFLLAGLSFLLHCRESAFSSDSLTAYYDNADYVYSGSGSVAGMDCGPHGAPWNLSHCVCEEGFRAISGIAPFRGTSETGCEGKRPVASAGLHSGWHSPHAAGQEQPPHCRSGFTKGKDYMKRCLNGSQQVPLDNRQASLFCSLVNFTLSLLTPACENVSLTTSLKETAASFRHVLVDSSLWSMESREEVASAATLLLQSLGSAAVTAALAAPENQTQTATTKLMAIQTKLTDENCSRQSDILQLTAHGDSLEIDCTAVTAADTKGPAAVAFLSYTGLESLLGGRFLQDENPGSEARPEQFRVNSRVVSASTSNWRKNIPRPINLTFLHLEDKPLLDRAICVHWDSTGQDAVWSPQGCQNLHSNVTHTRCRCHSLTSFVVLMAPGLIQLFCVAGGFCPLCYQSNRAHHLSDLSRPGYCHLPLLPAHPQLPQHLPAPTAQPMPLPGRSPLHSGDRQNLQPACVFHHGWLAALPLPGLLCLDAAGGGEPVPHRQEPEGGTLRQPGHRHEEIHVRLRLRPPGRDCDCVCSQRAQQLRNALPLLAQP